MLVDKRDLPASESLHPARKITFNSDKLKINLYKFAWRNWLITKPFDWIATPIYLLCSATLLYYREPASVSSPSVQWWQALIVFAAILFLFGLDRYEYWFLSEDISSKRAVGLWLCRIIVIQLITQLHPNEVSYFLYLIIPFSALFYFGSRPGIATGVGVCMLVAARIFLFPDPNLVIFRPALFVNLFIISTVLVLTTGIALIQEKISRNKAEQLLVELRQSQDQLEELATSRERTRLARDIHDSLGHYLTIINLQLSKIKAYKEIDPEASEQAVDTAKQLVKDALQDVQHSVRSLRTGQELFSLQKSLLLLIANSQSERLNIDLDISGNEEGISKQYLLILYRVAQEGLTNIQRHSGSKWAHLSLKLTPQRVQLIIEDRGKGFDVETRLGNHFQSGGYGLAGLRERLEIVGGQIYFDSKPGMGTRLTAIIGSDVTGRNDA